jgi:uncharacterized protein (TIGR02598 family)
MKLTHRIQGPGRRHLCGFSLVEITIAMGIVASVMIALLALLPYAMDSIREAKNTQIMARISNELVTNIQEMDWGPAPGYAMLERQDNQSYFFDAEGTPLKQQSADVAYQAIVKVRRVEDFLLPGGRPAAGGLNSYRRQITIKVAFSPPGRQVNFAQETPPLPYRVYNTMVTNLGQDQIR